MVRTKIIIVVICLITLLGIGAVAYIQVNKNKPTSQQISTSNATPLPTKSHVSLKSLLSQNQTVTCTIQFPDNQGNGTVYVNEGSIRGDFMTIQNKQNINTHLIQNGEYTYLWNDNSKEGTKIKVNLQDMTSSSNQKVDVDQEYEANCQSWTVDSSKFTPPADIKFSDLPELLKSQSSPMGKVDKSICDQLTDQAAKKSCLKSIEQ